MKLDNDTKAVVRQLILDRVFFPRSHALDISKFLDETDNKLDLWFLELAVRNSIRFTTHALGRDKILGMHGVDRYCSQRGISDDYSKRQEETVFIMNFIASIERDELAHF